MARTTTRLERFLIDYTAATGQHTNRIVRLAEFVRSHGHPCRIVQGRKTGCLALRCASSFGCDPSLPQAKRSSYRIELVRPNIQDVRDWLGY